ncbi:MAG: hypothetical protein QW815_05600 [Nitrososphaerota archaeon]
MRRLRSSFYGLYSRWVKLYPYIKRWAPWLLYLVIFYTLASGVVNVMVETARLGVMEAIILRTKILQTWTEVVINFLMMIIGSWGVYLMYQGGRRRVVGRASEVYIGFGLLLLVIAIALGFSILAEKGF